MPFWYYAFSKKRYKARQIFDHHNIHELVLWMCIWNVSSCLHWIHLFHGWSCDTDIVNEQNRGDSLLVTVLTISSSLTLSWNCFVMKPSRPHSSRSKYLSGIVVNKYVSWRRADYCWYNMAFNWKRLAVIVFSNGASLGILNERNLRKLCVNINIY